MNMNTLEKEIKLLRDSSDDTTVQAQCDVLTKLYDVFKEQGHSGMSAAITIKMLVKGVNLWIADYVVPEYKDKELIDLFEAFKNETKDYDVPFKRDVISLFKRLINYEPLTPVTFDDDQWNKDEDQCDNLNVKSEQHKRIPGLFRNRENTTNDWEYTFNDSLIKRTRTTIWLKDNGEEFVETGRNETWGGSCPLVVDEDGTMYRYSWPIIKDLDSYDFRTRYINAVDHEVKRDWWERYCNKAEIDQFKSLFDFKEITKLDDKCPEIVFNKLKELNTVKN